MCRIGMFFSFSEGYLQYRLTFTLLSLLFARPGRLADRDCRVLMLRSLLGINPDLWCICNKVFRLSEGTGDFLKCGLQLVPKLILKVMSTCPELIELVNTWIRGSHWYHYCDGARC